MSNIEEDIYNVKELLQGSKLYGQYDGNKYFKSIENILSEREQDKKRIKELEEDCKNCIIREELDDYVSYSIPIQKVKDKMEKLKTDLRFIACNKDCSKCFNKEGKALYRESDFIFCYAYHQIKILQELLEDK